MSKLDKLANLAGAFAIVGAVVTGLQFKTMEDEVKISTPTAQATHTQPQQP